MPQLPHIPRTANSCSPSARACKHTPTPRRQQLLAGISTCLLALPAFSADPTSNRETPNSDPYIQDLVRKSEEKKEERYQARLNDYYRRNFKEYFQFEGGAARQRGLSPQTSKDIQEWLKNNK